MLMQLICITILLGKKNHINLPWQLSNIIFFVFPIHFISVAENISDVMQSILFYQLMSCVLFSVFSLFALDQSIFMHKIDFTTICSLAALLSALIPTFVYCYFSEGLTADLLEVSDILYESMWYKLPNQEQKLLILPIQRAQRVFRLNGFKFVACSLDTFSRVKF